jgi:hypothetical protein
MLTHAYYRRHRQTCMPQPAAELRPSDIRQDDSALSLVKSLEPAPIDIEAFGKTLGEIITKSVSASRKRQKSRKYLARRSTRDKSRPPIRSWRA